MLDQYFFINLFRSRSISSSCLPSKISCFDFAAGFVAASLRPGRFIFKDFFLLDNASELKNVALFLVESFSGLSNALFLVDATLDAAPLFERLVHWFSTFSVPWSIFQPKLTSQPTLVNKIKFPSQNHNVL